MRILLQMSAWSLVMLTAASYAGELLPADRPVPQAVDHYIEAHLTQAGVQAAPAATEAALVRRLTLDLVGRVPTPAEVQAYVTSTAADKREQLVDRLLSSDGFVRHQTNELDALLMYGSRGSVKNYLTEAVRENRGWNQVFRELMLAQDEAAEEKKDGEKKDEGDKKRRSRERGPIEFLKTRVSDLDKLANDVSVRFFGVNISCAKCHDHPLVPDWKQAHFYGMKSFVGRMFDNGGYLGERAYGTVKFTTTKGEEFQAELMFLSGKKLDEASQGEPSKDDQKKESELLKELAKQKQPPPAPGYSRRARLVEVALSEGEQVYLARAISNRLWHRFFGHGLVMPLDQMHSENPPSHPELLDWLARDLSANGYDLKRLVRGLVLSNAYARSSQWQSGTRPDPALFAVAHVRALTPAQYSASLRLASADPQSLAADQKPEDASRRAEQLASDGGLSSLFEMPQEDFQIGVSEALVMSNSDRIQKDLLASGGKLAERLKDIADNRELVERAMQIVLSRSPDDEERKLLEEFVSTRGDRRLQACQQLTWVLLTSAEFRFNH